MASRLGIVGSRAGTASRYGWNVTPVADQPSPVGDAVQVATDTGELATALAQDAADAVAESLTTHMADYEKRVMADWPVKTGFSRSRFHITTKAGGSYLVVSLLNDAKYAGLIRQRGYAVENPAQRIVLDNSEKLAEVMARDIADYLAA